MLRHPPSRLAACILAGLCMSSPIAWSKPAPQRSAVARPAVPPPIRIGEINSYKARPELLEPYRKGWQLALDEINEQGGVLGRKLQVLVRDDGGTASGALAAAQQLAERDHVSLFLGGLHSEAALALASYADQNQAFFLATLSMSSRLTWEQGNRYTYRLSPSGWMQVAALVPRAFGLRKRRWALVYPNDAYGQPTVAAFRSMITSFQSKTTIVSDQPVPPGKLNAKELAHRLLQDKPDAIFSLLSGPDLVRFTHEAKAQGLLQNMAVVAPLAGRPETLQAMGTDAEAGWLVSGNLCEPAEAAGMQRFNQAYQARYDAAPGSASALGYIALKSIAEGLRKAGDASPQAVAAAFAGLNLDTPYGPVQFRALDHQATLGVCLAVTAEENGHIVARPTGYLEGSRLQPPDKSVHALRGKQQ
jgi:branched-chain amino acid transport system substrate-binding protein